MKRKTSVPLTFDMTNAIPVPLHFTFDFPKRDQNAVLVEASFAWQEQLLEKFPAGYFEQRTDAMRKEATRLKLSGFADYHFSKVARQFGARLFSERNERSFMLVNLFPDDRQSKLASVYIEEGGYCVVHKLNHDQIRHDSFFVFTQ